MSVLDRKLLATPFAVVDVETTGLSPIHDRIVEIAVILVRPGDEPRLVFETLVDPKRSMGATGIHGLTGEDVDGAPCFSEIAEALVAVLSNRVVAAHNADFDVAFLGRELDRSGFPAYFPHVCTMLMPRLANEGFPRLSLPRACEHHQIELGDRHRAAVDAMAAAAILRRELTQLRKAGLRTFGELRDADAEDLRFIHSLRLPLLASPPSIHRGQGLRPREPKASRRRSSPVARYLEAVLDAVADLQVEEHELEQVQALARELDLSPSEIRAVHVKIYSGMLGRFVEDARVDLDEVSLLHRLHQVLTTLGWAPGEPPSTCPDQA